MSYSRHDEAIVKPLAGLLGAAADDAVFLDIDSIKPGDVWKTDIEDAVRASSVFILCWCCNGDESEFIKHEIELALESVERRIVPVLFCSTPLPALLANRQWVDLRGRIVHPCSHDHSNETDGPPKMVIARNEGNTWHDTRPSPPPMASGARRVALVGVAATMLSLIGASLFIFPHAVGPVPPTHGKSTVCFFLEGPRVGERLDFTTMTPLAIGSPCVDGNGSSGVVVEPSPPAMLPSPNKFATLLLALSIVTGMLVMGIALRWLFKVVRKWRQQREANKVAALAASYFHDLGQGGT